MSSLKNTNVMAMYVDIKRCIGCDSCSVACKQEFHLEAGEIWSKIYGAENNAYPDVLVKTLPMRCQQCEEGRDAPCIKTCDSLGYMAINRRADGIVQVDPALCTGCRQCLSSCPYKAMSFNTGKTNKLGQAGVAEKCDFCASRLDAGLAPACVVTCVGITLDYGTYASLKQKYPNSHDMEHKGKFLYGNLGKEPKRPTSNYPDPVPFHDEGGGSDGGGEDDKKKDGKKKDGKKKSKR